MKTWQSLLRENDPGAEARLAPEVADAMRRAAVAHAHEPRPIRLNWQRPLAMAAILVLMVGWGLVEGRRAARRDAAVAPAVVELADPASEQRQLQFATPGGTRIIWVFNSEFALKETIP